MRTRVRWLAVLLALSVPGAGASEPAARELLAAADAAIAALPSLRYEVETEVRGPLAAHLPALRGTVTIAAPAEPGGRHRLRIEVEPAPPGGGTGGRRIVASDGTAVTSLEYATRRYVRRPLPAGAALLDDVSAALVRPLAAPDRLSRERSAVRVTALPEETIAGVRCQGVEVEYATDGGTARWFFAVSDRLPRRVERRLGAGAQASVIVTTLTRIETPAAGVDDAELFAPRRPEGFDEAGDRKPTRREAGLLPVGSEAPDFSLPLAGGGEVRLRDLRGKVVVLDFWATWCGPCRMAMPAVQRLYERYRGRPVAVFGVNCFERSTTADPVAFMRERGLTYPVLLGGSAVAAEQYKVTGVPAFYLIGPDGRILYAAAGFSPTIETEIVRRIEAALAAASQPAAQQPVSPPLTSPPTTGPPRPAAASAPLRPTDPAAAPE